MQNHDHKVSSISSWIETLIHNPRRVNLTDQRMDIVIDCRGDILLQSEKYAVWRVVFLGRQTEGYLP